jgi:hypothetical protein
MAGQIHFPKIDARTAGIEAVDHTFETGIVVEDEDDLVFSGGGRDVHGPCVDLIGSL